MTGGSIGSPFLSSNGTCLANSDNSTWRSGNRRRRRSTRATATTLKPGTEELMRHLPGGRSKYFVSASSFIVIAIQIYPRGRKKQRAVSNHTTSASEGLSIWLTEVVFLEPKLTEVPVKSAFLLSRRKFYFETGRRTDSC